jgi:hypothetical protein
LRDVGVGVLADVQVNGGRVVFDGAGVELLAYFDRNGVKSWWIQYK